MSGALFAAWRPDAEGRERLASLSAALAAAVPADTPCPRLRQPGQWHVTLCYLGARIEGAIMASVPDAFAEVAARIPPHAFMIERLAYWPRSGAIVALPHACAPLQALCDATRDAARRCGIRPEATTQPHVTLAYLGRGLERQPWLEDLDCGGARLEVAGFELLASGGGGYESIGHWPLAGTALPVEPTQASLL